MKYLIVLNVKHSYGKRRVRTYLKKDGEYKEIEQFLNVEIDIPQYIEGSFDDLWQVATPMPEHIWLNAQGQSASSSDTVYRDMLLALSGVMAQEGVTLSDVINTLEDQIALSDRAEQYLKFKKIANEAKASERDELFVTLLHIAVGHITE